MQVTNQVFTGGVYSTLNQELIVFSLIRLVLMAQNTLLLQMTSQ